MIRRLLCLFSLALPLALLSAAHAQTNVVERHFPPGTRQVFISHRSGVRADILARVAPLIEGEIADGHYPGAVVLAYHNGHLLYRGVFGSRRIVPDQAPMRFNTIFDLASLTKVVATTPAVMQLIEQGRLRLDRPVADYWPEFARNGKGAVTIRELLTHTSGLPPDIPSPGLVSLNHEPVTHYPGWPPDYRADQPWHGEAAALQRVEQVGLIARPGTRFIYSDVNFLTLAALVERITGERIDRYAARHVFQPLGMRDTEFNPPAALRDRIAPTQVIEGKLRWGTVHDPTATAMDGVSGLAGAFSTASDLARYCQTLLNGGRIPGTHRYLLSPLTVLKMTTPQTPHELTDIRGLGWDLDSPFSNRGVLLPIGSFGHTGFTGTSLWIDPTTKTFVILLTSRLHPTPDHSPRGVVTDRRLLANLIAASLTDVPLRGISNTGTGERARAFAQP